VNQFGLLVIAHLQSELACCTTLAVPSSNRKLPIWLPVQLFGFNPLVAIKYFTAPENLLVQPPRIRQE